MVKGISAVDAIYGSTKKTANNAAKKAINAIKEHSDEIISTGVLVGGAGLYGAALHHYLKDDEVNISSVSQPDIAEKQSLIKRISEKFKEKFSIDLNNPPEGIDPSEPYMMNKAGGYIMDEYGAIPNPWYNPDFVNQGINAVTSTQLNPVTMDSFLKHAVACGTDSADSIASIADVPFSGDAADIDDSTLEAAVKGIKSILENVIDFM